ncbi:hypothetical protein [Amycolatopsis vastitatis]|uniref:hypothetical protein n=1 Tax=Amycolatopsis vastitatis TaxID=1905142 RepID=UPI0013042654|nr:hypothetical protein [Amycolatopsis vastitatis]
MIIEHRKESNVALEHEIRALRNRAADSCRVHIVVPDSGPPDDEPAPAAKPA